KTERAMLALRDEGEDFGDSRILSGQRLHRIQPLGKDARAVKQALIERAHFRQPLLGELAALHADDVQPFEARILAVGEPEWNDVAAHAADSADHHLRPDPRELVHGRQPADEDEIADLAVTAERGRRCENPHIPDLAIMHEITTTREVTDAA